MVNSRTSFETSDVVVTLSRALPLRNMLIRENCLGLRILWNINSGKRPNYSSKKDVERWVKHEFRARNQQQLTRKQVSIVAKELIHDLTSFDLIECTHHKSKKRISHLRILPKVRSLTIILDEDPSAKLNCFSDFAAVCEKLEEYEITSKENVKVVFPNSVSVKDIGDKKRATDWAEQNSSKISLRKAPNSFTPNP